MKTPTREGVGANWWPGAESNHRHADFQSAALPTELPGRNTFASAQYSAEPQIIAILGAFSNPF